MAYMVRMNDGVNWNFESTEKIRYTTFGNEQFSFDTKEEAVAATAKDISDRINRLEQTIKEEKLSLATLILFAINENVSMLDMF